MVIWTKMSSDLDENVVTTTGVPMNSARTGLVASTLLYGALAVPLGISWVEDVAS